MLNRGADPEAVYNKGRRISIRDVSQSLYSSVGLVYYWCCKNQIESIAIPVINFQGYKS